MKANEKTQALLGDDNIRIALASVEKDPTIDESVAPLQRALIVLERTSEALCRLVAADEVTSRVLTGLTFHAGAHLVLRLKLGVTNHQAVEAAYQTWLGQAALLGVDVSKAPVVPLPPLSLVSREGAEWQRLVELYQAVVSKRLIDEDRQLEGRRVLEQFRTELNLSFDQLGRLLGVNGETVRRWMVGAAPISMDQLAAISEKGSVYERIRSHFHPQRIAIVVRRPSEAFGDQRALDWMLAGRMAEVMRVYDAELRFQA